MLKVELPEKMRKLFCGPARMRIAYGGRGSAKSWGFARMALVRAMERERIILCARELQNSIKDSVHRLLVSQIAELEMQDYFDVGESFIRCKPTKSFFIFKGLRNNINEIKSTEGINICWVTEGQGVAKDSWETLTPTIRTPDSEIWVDYNPLFDDDPIHKMALNPAPRTRVTQINWRDNPWFPEVLNEDRLDMARTDPDRYQHVWEGQCVQITDAQVLKGKYAVGSFLAPPSGSDGPYYGLDFGFSQDPCALVKMWIYNNCLYIEHEAGGVGVEIDDMPDMIRRVPGADKHVIRADCSQPQTISYLKNRGLNVIGAKKWEGSREDGVNHLRSFDKIIIHERCVNTIREARLWSYKQDRKTKDILPILLDKNDHWMDAVRYGLEPLIGGGSKEGFILL